MMTETEIRKIARGIAQAAQHRVSNLEREVIDLEAETAKKKQALDAARLAPKRLANFSIKIGADYQCPRCWIEHEARSALRPISGGGDKEDLFRCGKCGFEFGIPIPF